MSQLILITIIVTKALSSFCHCFNTATISNNATTKNKPRLYHEGYSYIIDRPKNEKTYRRCIKYFSHHCRSRLHTCTLTYVIVKTPTEHTCKVDGTTLQLRIFNERVVHRRDATGRVFSRPIPVPV